MGRHETRISKKDLQNVNEKLSILQPAALLEYFKMFNQIKIKHSLVPHDIKAKLILFQLLDGCPSHELPIVTSPTFRRIYDKVWTKHANYINNWIEDWLLRLSTPELRVLHSHLYNPNPFKSVTMFADGKDFVTALTGLENEKKLTKNGKSTLTSAKNKFKNGGKVIFVDDSRMMPISFSKMVGANQMYDGHLLLTMNLQKIMQAEYDNLIYDHHFDSACEEMIKLAKLEKINLKQSNFTPAIRKLPGQSFTTDELDYNKRHGSFRSYQETSRNAALVNLFKRFSSSCKMRARNFDVLLLQMKLSVILYSISKHQLKYPQFFSEINFNIELFEYPSENSPPPSIKVSNLLQRGDEMIKRQLAAIKTPNIISSGDLTIETSTESDDSESDLTIFHSGNINHEPIPVLPLSRYR